MFSGKGEFFNIIHRIYIFDGVTRFVLYVMYFYVFCNYIDFDSLLRFRIYKLYIDIAFNNHTNSLNLKSRNSIITKLSIYFSRINRNM